jgi:hypothetical protein
MSRYYRVLNKNLFKEQLGKIKSILGQPITIQDVFFEEEEMYVVLHDLDEKFRSNWGIQLSDTLINVLNLKEKHGPLHVEIKFFNNLIETNIMRKITIDEKAKLYLAGEQGEIQ